MVLSSAAISLGVYWTLAALGFLATLVLAPIALTRHRDELAALTRGERALAVLSGFFLAIHFATWITSLEYTSVASSVVLVTTTPLWVALLAPFTIKESLNRSVLAGMALALVGVIGVGLSDTCHFNQMRLSCPGLEYFFQGKAILGDFLATSGAIVAAAYVLIGRRLRGRLSLVGYTFLVYGAAAVFLAVSLFCSALTENQIIAVIVSFAIVGLLWILNKILIFFPSTVATVLEYLSIDYHFSNIARGVIDSRDIIYYLCAIGFSLYMGSVVLGKRRWS